MFPFLLLIILFSKIKSLDIFINPSSTINDETGEAGKPFKSLQLAIQKAISLDKNIINLLSEEETPISSNITIAVDQNVEIKSVSGKNNTISGMKGRSIRIFGTLKLNGIYISTSNVDTISYLLLEPASQLYINDCILISNFSGKFIDGERGLIYINKLEAINLAFEYLSLLSCNSCQVTLASLTLMKLKTKNFKILSCTNSGITIEKLVIRESSFELDDILFIEGNLKASEIYITGCAFSFAKLIRAYPLQGNDLTIYGAYVYNNTIMRLQPHEGFIEISGNNIDALITISNSTFYGNFLGAGAAINIKENSGQTILSALVFNNQSGGSQISCLTLTTIGLSQVLIVNSNKYQSRELFESTATTSIKIENGKKIVFDSLFLMSLTSYSVTCGIVIINDDGGDFGDALANDFTINISNSYFFKNKVVLGTIMSYDGCAIYLQTSNTITVSQTIFERNTIYKSNESPGVASAPAIYFANPNQNASIISSSFIRHQSPYYCNCIDFSGRKLDVSQIKFIQNEPDLSWAPNVAVNEYTSNFPYGFGGAIKFAGSDLIVTNCHFSLNVNTLGGAIYVDALHDYQRTTFTITNNLFLNNSGLNYGGCIYISRNVKNIFGMISNANASHNYADFNGGFLSIHHEDPKAEIIVDKSYFSFNNADFGGVFACFNIFGRTLFKNNVFKYNVAAFFSPEFMYEREKYFYLNSLGRIDLGGGPVFTILGKPETEVFLENNLYESNWAFKRGGVGFILGGTVYDQHSKYINNTSGEFGTYLIHVWTTMRLVGCQFIKENSMRIGGIINAVEFCAVFIVDSTFRDIHSLSKSAAVIISDDSSLFIDSTSFQNLSSPEGVILSAIRITSNFIEIRNILVTDSAATKRSLFKLQSCKNVLITDSEFYNIKKGLIYMVDSGVRLMNMNLFSVDCTGLEYQGCISSSYNTSTLLDNLDIKLVNHQVSGGIAYSESSVLIFNRINVDLIYTQKWAGCLESVSSNITINNSHFSNFLVGCIFIKTSSLIIDQSTFQEDFYKPFTTDVNMGSTLILISSETVVSRSFFLGGISRAPNGGIVRAERGDKDKDSKASLIFLDSSVKNSIVSLKGGVLYISNLNVLISNCIFFNNTALKGGAIFYEQDRSRASLLRVRNSVFQHNIALEEGGVIKYTDKTPDISDSIFEANEAPYGPVFASYAVELIMKLQPKDPESFKAQYLEEFVTGALLPLDFIFFLVDTQGQIVTINEQIDQKGIIDFSNSTSTLNQFYLDQNLKEVIINGNTVANVKNGSFTFDTLQFSSKPTKISLYLKVTSNLIKSNPSTLNDSVHDRIYDGKYFYEFKLDFRACVVGEIFDNKTNTCYKCKFGWFSFNPNDQFCRECPPHAICRGGSVIELEKGYWRSSNTSTNIIECSPHKDSCLGGENSTCEEGYTGPLCQVCGSGKAGILYEKSSSKRCKLCSEKKIIIVKMVFIFIFLLTFFLVLVRSNIGDFTTHQNKIWIDDESKASFAPHNEMLSIYFRVILNYFQVLSLASNLDLDWPEAISDFFGVQMDIGNIGEYIISSDCLFKELVNLDPVYFRACILSVCPYVVFFFTMGFWSLVNLFSKGTNIKTKFYLTLLISCSYLQPSILSSISRLLSCKELEKDQYLLSTKLSLECFTNEHLNLLYIVVLPNLIIWVIIYPILTFLILLKNKSKLREPEIINVYGFLYKGYKNQYYFWEYWIIYRKIITIAVITTNMNPSSKSLIIILLLGVSVYLQAGYRPFENEDLNNIELRSTVVTLSSIYLGTLYFYSDDIFMRLLLIILIFFMNIYFLLYALVKMVETQLESLIRFLSKWSVIKRKISYFVDSYKKVYSTLQKEPNSTVKRLSLVLDPKVIVHNSVLKK